MNGNGYGDFQNGNSRPQGGAGMRSNYIRKEESLETLWQNNSSSGINFSKYDKIPVKVLGDNVPKPINTFDDAGFVPLVMSNVKRAGYKTPTPVQKYGIPIILEGRDMIASAQTGSGKTAAFLLPVIHNLSGQSPSGKEGMAATPQVVVVSPTRELATQIYDEARKFCGGTKLRCGIVYGGTSVQSQLLSLSEGCNILVAAPGRLLDFAERGRNSFKNCQYLVIDEADRMMDMGFLPQLKRCVYHHTMKKQGRQTLMFSATFPDAIARLANEFLSNHLHLQVGMVGGACSDVRQSFHDVTQMNKMERNEMLVEMLQDQLKKNKKDKTLIFVEQKKHADVLALFLCQEDIPTTTMHGDRAQEEREMALEDFKSGRKPILIATAVAARGLDIRGVTHVINFQMPKDVDEYVHRIGRTGRVGNTGRATSFFDFNTDGGIVHGLVKILSEAKQPVPDWLTGGRRYGGGF